MPPTKRDPDERVSIALDPEDALKVLLAVEPDKHDEDQERDKDDGDD